MFLENYLGIDIYVDNHPNYAKIYFAEIYDRELKCRKEIRQPSIEYVKELIRDIVAYNYYHELKHICLTFNIDTSLISQHNEIANAIIDSNLST